MNNDEFMRDWRKLRDILGFTPKLNNLIAMNGKKTIDIVALDKEISSRVPEYDGDACMYKGKPEYSLSKMIKEHYGNETYELITKLMKGTK